MRLPLARYGLREIVAGTIFCWALFGLSLYLFWPAAFVFALLWGFLLFFFRDPERSCAGREGQMLSPADGTVMDVEVVEAPAFIEGEAVRIGIFMSLLNVHVNRIPSDGIVRYVQYRKGKFHGAKNKLGATENEHHLVGLETSSGKRVLVNMIAGVLARRIVCRLRPGQAVTRGQRMGMVKFGSRAEIYLPLGDNYEILVNTRTKVKAGRDVVAVWQDDLPQEDDTAL